MPHDHTSAADEQQAPVVASYVQAIPAGLDPALTAELTAEAERLDRKLEERLNTEWDRYHRPEFDPVLTGEIIAHVIRVSKAAGVFQPVRMDPRLRDVINGTAARRAKAARQSAAPNRDFYDIETVDVTNKFALRMARSGARLDGVTPEVRKLIKNRQDQQREAAKEAKKREAVLAAGGTPRAARGSVAEMSDEERKERQRVQARERKRKQRHKAKTPPLTEEEKAAQLTALLIETDALGLPE